MNLLLNGENNNSGNTLYLRCIDDVMQRIKDAPTYSITNTNQWGQTLIPLPVTVLPFKSTCYDYSIFY